MPRINEHVFKLKNEEYLLSYYDKPKVTKNGIEQKVLPVLREYISNEKLPIQLVNDNGRKEFPYTLARKVLEFFSDKEFKPKQHSDKTKKIENKHKISEKSSLNYKKSTNQKMEDSFKALDWEKIQDKNVKKLVIIGCSDSKNLGGEHSNSINYFSNNEIYNSLIKDREERVKEYRRLIDVEPNYLIYKDKQKYIKRNKKPIPKDYFKHCLAQGLTKPAFERYSGKFYSDELKELYLEKNQNSNLHILIISGLYGVIEFRDSIIDYHLEISKIPFWTNQHNTSILESVENYIHDNQIDNKMVFYSLSQVGNHSYVNALKPIGEWKNLWITHKGLISLQYSAEALQVFLSRL
jgi:hypothetical protein